MLLPVPPPAFLRVGGLAPGGLVGIVDGAAQDVELAAVLDAALVLAVLLVEELRVLPAQRLHAVDADVDEVLFDVLPDAGDGEQIGLNSKAPFVAEVLFSTLYHRNAKKAIHIG